MTYLYWDDIDESILTYNLIVEYDKNIEIDHPLLQSIYNTVDSIVYIFNMEKYKHDIDMFLDGKYSEFSADSKQKIIKYYKWIVNGRTMYSSEAKIAEGSPHWHVFFYPRIFVNNVAKEWVYPFKYYDDEEEAFIVADTMTEFCQIFNLEKETFTKKRI